MNRHLDLDLDRLLLTQATAISTLKVMEVHFSPEKEARLQQVATRTGKAPAQVVEEVVDRMLEYGARFIKTVEEGRASARRGDLLEHEEAVESIQLMLRA